MMAEPFLPSSTRRAAWVSTGILLYLLLVRFIAQPLHARGDAQSFLAAINASGFVLGFPGFALAGAVNQRAVEHVSNFQFWFGLVSNFILYTAGLRVVAGFMRSSQNTKQIAVCPNHSRRRFLRKTANLTTGGVLGGAFGYSLFLEPARLRITPRTFTIRDLPPSLDGLTIAQVSDVHHGPWFSLARVCEMVRMVNALRADLIVLTGDYVYESADYIDPAVEAMAALRAKIGIVGVLGNHDWWDHGVPMKAAFARHGLPLIDNTRLILTADRKLSAEAEDGLCLAGVGDLWEDVPDYDAALARLPDHMPRLLLAHNPDTAEDARFIAGKYRVDLMLSGHTHGGQVWVPGFGTPIVPSRFGQKYASGLVQGPACPVFISRGIGLSGLPIRFGVPPEIVLMTLKRGALC